jgi:predicted nuclease with TOPRIM domain
MTEQELKARVTELENTIDRLRAKNVALEDNLEDAEAEAIVLLNRISELELELENAKENVDPNKIYADWKEDNLD